MKSEYVKIPPALRAHLEQLRRDAGFDGICVFGYRHSDGSIEIMQNVAQGSSQRAQWANFVTDWIHAHIYEAMDKLKAAIVTASERLSAQGNGEN